MWWNYVVLYADELCVCFINTMCVLYKHWRYMLMNYAMWCYMYINVVLHVYADV